MPKSGGLGSVILSILRQKLGRIGLDENPNASNFLLLRTLRSARNSSDIVLQKQTGRNVIDLIPTSSADAGDLLRVVDNTDSYVIGGIQNQGFFWGKFTSMQLVPNGNAGPATITLNNGSNVIQQANTTGGTVTYNLPAANTGYMLYVFVDSSRTAGTNNITIARNGSDTIQGAAANQVINTNGGTLALLSTNGTDWKILFKYL